jgi:hypothetical protein
MYPLSLREAFPQDYSNPIEGPRQRISASDVFVSGLAVIVWGWLVMFFIKD